MMTLSISHYVKIAKTRLHPCVLAVSVQLGVPRNIQNNAPIDICKKRIRNKKKRKTDQIQPL